MPQYRNTTNASYIVILQYDSTEKLQTALVPVYSSISISSDSTGSLYEDVIRVVNICFIITESRERKWYYVDQYMHKPDQVCHR